MQWQTNTMELCITDNIIWGCSISQCPLPFAIGSFEMLEICNNTAPHSSTLAWKIPWTEEPGRLQSMGSRRVGHDWATSFSLFNVMHWRRKWQPTPVFLPGESQGRGIDGGLPSTGSHRVRHDWSNLAAAAARILAWKISWTEESGRLQSKGLQGMRHNWAHAWVQVM